MLKICWTLSNGQLLGAEHFLSSLPEIMTEEQAPGGHARPSLGVHKLGNSLVDFRLPFVGVFQFKLKSGQGRIKLFGAPRQ